MTSFRNTGWYRVVSHVTCFNVVGSDKADVTIDEVLSVISGSSLFEARLRDPTAGKVTRTLPTPKAAPVMAFSPRISIR